MRLRRAARDDMAAVAVLHRLTMKTSLPYLPDLHTPAEDLAFFRDVLFDRGEMWVAEGADGAIVGTHLKRDGVTWNEVDRARADRFMEAVGSAREPAGVR